MTILYVFQHVFAGFLAKNGIIATIFWQIKEKIVFLQRAKVCSTKIHPKIHDKSMKREIGKWFLDIAKYIVTAVILKELFGGFEEKSIVVSVATFTALFAFIAGIIILRNEDRKNERYVKLKSNRNSVEVNPKQTSPKRKGNKK